MKTILVVDDERDIRDTLKVLLERQGYRVLTAVDGDDGLRKFSKQPVDLVLLDIMMPGTPVRQIVPKFKGTKVCFLTVVRLSDQEKKKLLSLKNVVGFIAKPFDIDELLRAVAQQLR